MTLNELKGSGQLLAGFGDFLKEWLPSEWRNETRKPWSEDSLRFFSEFPPTVKEFYETVRSWRFFSFGGGDWQLDGWQHGRDELAEPRCRYHTNGCLELVSGQGWIVGLFDDGRIGYAEGHPDHKGICYFGVEQALDVPIDEFLVAFGLQELILRCPFRVNSPEEMGISPEILYGSAYVRTMELSRRTPSFEELMFKIDSERGLLGMAWGADPFAAGLWIQKP